MTQQRLEIINESRIETSSADMFEVRFAPGEIDLLFGNMLEYNRVRGMVSANLSNLVILSPLTARRMVSLLSDTIRRYENDFGILTGEVPLSPAPDRVLMHNDFHRYASKRTSEMADSLMGLIESLDVDYGLERSFKISDRSFLANRFIASFRKDQLIRNPDDTVISAFIKMGMPVRYLQECRELLPVTEFVHVGLEERNDGCLYKAYLEFKLKLKDGLDEPKGDHAPLPVFAGFKWDPSDNNKSAVTRYTLYPLLSTEQIQEKLSILFEHNPASKSFEASRNIVKLAANVMSGSSIVYLEACEDINPRKSFDLNFYGANLCIRDIYPSLMDIGRHYSLPSEQFPAFCDNMCDKSFGHISGGIDREGEDFLTVYYGVEGVEKRPRPQAGRPPL